VCPQASEWFSVHDGAGEHRDEAASARDGLAPASTSAARGIVAAHRLGELRADGLNLERVVALSIS
jgi:hypothetical protein